MATELLEQHDAPETQTGDGDGNNHYGRDVTSGGDEHNRDFDQWGRQLNGDAPDAEVPEPKDLKRSDEEYGRLYAVVPGAGAAAVQGAEVEFMGHQTPMQRRVRNANLRGAIALNGLAFGSVPAVMR